FSDSSGEYELIIADQEGMHIKTIQLPNPTFFFKPVWSPDGKHIAYTDTDYNLRITQISTSKTIIADTDRFAHPNRSLNPIWSPDSRWIAYAKIGKNHFKSIMVYDVENSKVHELTDAMADAISPVWDADGKYLYFLASTDYGLNSGWLDMSSYDRPITRSLYAVSLTKDVPSPLLPKSDEEKIEIKKEDDSKSITTIQVNTKNKKTKPTVIESPKDTSKSVSPQKIKVEIDFEGIGERIVAIDLPAKNYTALYPAPKDMVFVEVNNDDQTHIIKYNFKDLKSETHINAVNYFAVSHDLKSTLYRSGATWGILNSSDSNKKSGDGKLENISNMKIKITPKDEWKQIFREGWRYQRDFLYVDNVHGAPWNDVYQWYAPWVDHVRHRSDLNYVVDILGGEVAVGHSYTSGGDIPSAPSVNIGLLGADFEISEGFYKIKKIYNGESWNPTTPAPLRGPGLKIKEGYYIIAVNGSNLTSKDNIYKAFENTADKVTFLRINDKPTKEQSWTVLVKPVSNENQLRFLNWQENNRKKVDSLSKGQLAYVYVPNTGRGGYTNFNRYYFAQQDKKGVIIDERNNGGGSAADYMVDIMARPVHGYFNSRASDRTPFVTPNAGIFGPKVMLINERAGSGGDLLPYMFHKM
nr:PDZ domain-containing protein [Saprospiraceae bacterium]